MTRKEEAEIRSLVDAGGWDAVRKHPVYGPIWAQAVKESREFRAKIVEPV